MVRLMGQTTRIDGKPLRLINRKRSPSVSERSNKACRGGVHAGKREKAKASSCESGADSPMTINEKNRDVYFLRKEIKDSSVSAICSIGRWQNRIIRRSMRSCLSSGRWRKRRSVIVSISISISISISVSVSIIIIGGSISSSSSRRRMFV